MRGPKNCGANRYRKGQSNPMTALAKRRGAYEEALRIANKIGMIYHNQMVDDYLFGYDATELFTKRLPDGTFAYVRIRRF